MVAPMTKLQAIGLALDWLGLVLLIIGLTLGSMK
jgi:hypothetical protein